MKKMGIKLCVLALTLLTLVEITKLHNLHSLHPSHKPPSPSPPPSFPQGSLYQLLSIPQPQSPSLALRPQQPSPARCQLSRLIAGVLNQNQLNQLFFIEKLNNEEDSYQIVSAVCDLVWDQEGGEIKLRRAKGAADQMFRVEGVAGEAGRFWVKTSVKGTTAVSLSNVLRYDKFDPNSNQQIFLINPVPNPSPLLQTCMLQSPQSSLFLDTPQSPFQPTLLTLSKKTLHLGQRWQWIKSGRGFLLKNMLSNLYLSVMDGGWSKGLPVIQGEKTGDGAQLWLPVLGGAGQGVKVRGMGPNGLFLGLGVYKGKERVVLVDESNAVVWRVTGFIPKL